MSKLIFELPDNSSFYYQLQLFQPGSEFGPSSPCKTIYGTVVSGDRVVVKPSVFSGDD